METYILLGLPALGLILLVVSRYLKRRNTPSTKWKIGISSKLAKLHKESHTKDVKKAKKLLNDYFAILSTSLKESGSKKKNLNEQLNTFGKELEDENIKVDLIKDSFDQNPPNLTEIKACIREIEMLVKFLIAKKSF